MNQNKRKIASFCGSGGKSTGSEKKKKRDRQTLTRQPLGPSSICSQGMKQSICSFTS